MLCQRSLQSTNIRLMTLTPTPHPLLLTGSFHGGRVQVKLKYDTSRLKKKKAHNLSRLIKNENAHNF